MPRKKYNKKTANSYSERDRESDNGSIQETESTLSADSEETEMAEPPAWLEKL